MNSKRRSRWGVKDCRQQRQGPVPVASSSCAGCPYSGARRVRRTFAAEIESGQVLVVIDACPDAFEQIEPQLARAGALRLPFESTTALTS